ncbi:MAG: ABC transporter substrate-binding protein [Streptosporangiaceae bacterium]|jgi:NitT/TauT family transport system substrate-binding protein
MPTPAAPLHAPAPSARSPIRRALAALTLTTAVVAAACGSSKASTSRDSNAVEKPDLTVAVVPAISAAGLYIAQQRGYFTAAGLRVKILLVASGVDAIPNLASGSVDIDEGQWAANLSAEAAGAVRLYALAAASAGGPGVQEVVVPAGSPVTSVVQLHGKTIAVNALGGLAVLLTDNVLADHGVPVKDVHYALVPFPAMGAALAAHRVDAAFIAESSLSAAEIAVGAVPLFDVNQGATQNFPISGYVVTQAWIARYPRTAAFVGALERGQQVAATGRAAVEHALIPGLHISKTTAAVMALGTFPLPVSAVAVQRVADLMQSNGLLAKSASTGTLVKELVTR